MRLQIKFSLGLGFAIGLWYPLGGRGQMLEFSLVRQFMGSLQNSHSAFLQICISQCSLQEQMNRMYIDRYRQR